MKDIHIDVPGQSEDALQQKCIFWFHNKYPDLRGLLFAVPNGGARNGKQGKTLRLTGVVAGVFDLMLLWHGRAWCLELKNEVWKELSEPQEKWCKKITSQGIYSARITSLSEFKCIIKEIMKTDFYRDKDHIWSKIWT